MKCSEATEIPDGIATTIEGYSRVRKMPFVTTPNVGQYAAEVVNAAAAPFPSGQFHSGVSNHASTDNSMSGIASISQEVAART